MSHFFDGCIGQRAQIRFCEISHICPGCFDEGEFEGEEDRRVAVCDAPENTKAYEANDRSIVKSTSTGMETRSQAESTAIRIDRVLDFLANGNSPAKAGDWVCIYLVDDDMN